MSNSADVRGSGTPRSSHLIPTSSATLTPTWGRPRSPLPPHRLAKLANALGVSTPMPAVHHSNTFLSRSFSETSSSMDYRRSPTPSAAASNFSAYAPSVSKYLLHVIPPLHLPHESDNEFDMTPPPPTASGYHSQFRRGTLVPIHANFQAQLGAIAKEYALPSTAGLILYLVSSAKTSQQRSPTPSSGNNEDCPDEPGPRLSEDIWKHLWTRVMGAERRDDFLIPPSPVGTTPNMFSLSAGTQSTPFLPLEANGQPLRPFISTNGLDGSQPQPNARSFTPSTPSSSSDQQSNAISAPHSSSSVTQSEPETPDTSSGSGSFRNDPAERANSLDLPGLDSPSIIPILAKVEFEIDRQKAAWYDPWLRSRRMNHAKRAESRTGRKASFNEGDEKPDDFQDRKLPLSLLTGRKEALSPVSFVVSTGNAMNGPELESILTSPLTLAADEQESDIQTAGYEELRGSQDNDDWSDGDGNDEEEYTDEFTAKVAMQMDIKDPLADVFGSDADTWASIQDSQGRRSNRHTDTNIVELALSGADLTALPTPTKSEFEYLGKEEDEVQALLDQMARPRLSVSIPSSPPEKRSSSPSGRKHVPPPLVLLPNVNSIDLGVPAEPSPMPSSAGSTNLAYLTDRSSAISAELPGERERDRNDNNYEDPTRIRSPAESEKRAGAVFDDLDLGLDPSEDYDDDDPHDRRRSQYLMKAQLDEIERTMAQLSPRMLQVDLEDEPSTYMSNNSMSLSPRMNGDVFPPTPRLPQHPDPVENDSNRDSTESKKAAVWPAVPFSSLNDSALPSPPLRSDGPPSPPRLAVNGVTTSAPKSYMPNPRTTTSEMSKETESRKRELEEELGYPPLIHAVGGDPGNVSNSPIIPLSPDPFGRFSSTPEPTTGSRQSSAYWDPHAAPQLSLNDVLKSSPPKDTHDRKRSNSTATSRFSADSITEEDLNVKSSRTNLITVNTIKRLWRKSNKNPSISGLPPTPTSTRPPSRAERPSLDIPDVAPPKTPTFGRFSPQPAPSRPSQEQQSAPPPHQLAIPQSQQVSMTQQPANPQQLSIPFNGRSAHPSPIVAAQMRPGRGNSTLDRLHFDQESPYPTRRAPYPPQPQSPPSQHSSNLPSSSANFTSTAPLAPPVEKEKMGVRKSILKSWKSATSSTAQAPPLPEPRSSLDRSNVNGGGRGRRPSVLNFGSTRGSTASPEIPPSPAVPTQFLDNGNDRRQSVRSRLTSSSIDSSRSPPQASQMLQARSTSPQRSITSSRDSQETRPSFDVSQFEIVSPKMSSTLSYPYHGLDHEP